jgi:hypothetical protein
MWGNTVAIHSVLKKNYKAKFSTSSILKKNKINKNNSEKKNTKKMKKRRRQFWEKKSKSKMKKNGKKNMWGKVKTKFLTSSILKKNQQR